MPYKDKEQERKRNREYTQQKRREIDSCEYKQMKQHNTRCTIRYREDEEFRQRILESHARRRKELKNAVIQAYGGKCARCGESDPRVIAIHHQFGGGNQIRKELKGSSEKVLLDLVKRGFPQDEGIELLCMNCHTKEHAIW